MSKEYEVRVMTSDHRNCLDLEQLGVALSQGWEVLAYAMDSGGHEQMYLKRLKTS